jgi:hypothetical protein
MAYYMGDYYRGDYYRGDAPKRKRKRAGGLRRAAARATRRGGEHPFARKMRLARARKRR